MSSALLLYASFGFPLLLTALVLVPQARLTLVRLLPAAPAPALVAALAVPTGTTASLPATLLGAGLTLDGAGRVFLGVSALVWMLAGAHARMAIDGEGRGRFAGFWLATLTGNLLVFVASDVVSFYLAFSILSLAAFGLVVHAGSAEARRAARLYLVLAMIGEVCLLAAFMIGANAAGGVSIGSVRHALAASPGRDLALALLLAGFGIKAGLMPLHFWLPLAHPAAPVPASAVLSGAIVKAGIFGLIRFLPLDISMPAWAGIIVSLGLATAFFGIGFGLAQQRPKTVLAYSTVSQMGIVVVILGGALGVSDGGSSAIAAAALYSAHHGPAKGALFLAVGAIGAARGRLRAPFLCLLAVVALGVAGLPLTGGALAKLGIKDAVPKGATSLLVTLSAIGTALLMLRFLHLLSTRGRAGQGRDSTLLLAPTLLCAAAALAAPWLLFPQLAQQGLDHALRPAALWSGFWPILAAGAVLVLDYRLLAGRRLKVPEGDIAVAAERAFAWAARALKPVFENRPPRIAPLPRSPWRHLDRIERRLGRWESAAPILLLLGATFFLLLLLGR